MRLLCKKRDFSDEKKEWMDIPQPRHLLEDDLRFIGQLNRWFGSHRQVRGFLQRYFRDNLPATILDCGTGFGDIPRQMSQWCRENGKNVKITATDLNSMTLQIAREHSAQWAEVISFEEQDMTKLSYPDASFDLVICNMALHHFSEADALKVLEELKRVARHSVFVTDIIRSDSTVLSAWIVSRFTSNPVSRHDAVVSSFRAFTLEEFTHLARKAGYVDFQARKYPFCRQEIFFEKK